jgi:hypothetical protein
MKPSLPPLQRCLPPLLLILLCLAMAGCGTTTPRSTGTESDGSAATRAGDGTAVKSASTAGAAATPATRTVPGTRATPGTRDTPATRATLGTQAKPKFRGSVATGRDVVRDRVRWSWRRGCPVGPEELRLLRADYWGFDRRVHRGELLVHRDHARRVLAVLGKLFAAGYPIQRLRVVDAYRADDDRSMAANNTSGFNCRRVSGSSSWSEHAFGRAVDLNPLRNPYVTRGGRVSPPAGRPYANRARRAAGMIHANDLVVRAFAAAGWRWGGYWSGSRDYQHFSSTGR